MEIDYSDLFESICDDMGLNYTARQGKSNHEPYYIGQSLLLDDSNPSFQMFIHSGWCSSYNGDINGKNRIHFKEVCRLSGYLSEYISFILKSHNIPTYKLNQYKELIIKKQLGEYYNYSLYNELVDLFGKFYLSQSDILQTNEIQPIQKIKFNKAKSKKKKSKIVELDQTEEQYQICLDYIKSRSLEFIDGVCEPCTLSINSWNVNCVKLAYPDGFIKYRLINSKLRYMSTGSFKQLFESKVVDGKTCVIVEGEIEALSIRDLVDCSVYSMSNTNSISDLTQLEKYDNIYVLIDNDTFAKVQQGLSDKLNKAFPDKNIIIKPKIESNDKSIDFNSLLQKDENKLKEILKKLLTDIN